jgi:hypothetical protein
MTADGGTAASCAISATVDSAIASGLPSAKRAMPCRRLGSCEYDSVIARAIVVAGGVAIASCSVAAQHAGLVKMERLFYRGMNWNTASSKTPAA